jgi:hypothetical protein
MLRFSRWRRLPGLHRVTERKIPTHRAEPQRFTLFLPGDLLDLAEDLARRAGARTPQHYCEDLLARALKLEGAQPDTEVGGIVASALDALDGFVHSESLDTERDVILEPAAPSGPDPAPGAAGGAGAPLSPFRLRVQPALPGLEEAAGGEPGSDPPVRTSAPVASVPEPASPGPAASSPGRDVASRHAALEPPIDPQAFLARLRRGQPVPSALVDELIAGLRVLERRLAGGRMLDRELARALHRLAYEPQVLISEAWPALAHDPETLQCIRRVQEGVERIFEPGPEPSSPADSRQSP